MVKSVLNTFKLLSFTLVVQFKLKYILYLSLIKRYRYRFFVSYIQILDTCQQMYLETKYKILSQHVRYVSRYLYLRYSTSLVIKCDF